MHFLSPWKTAHPAGPVTFMNTSISPIDYMCSQSQVHSVSHIPHSQPPPSHSQPATHAFLLAFPLQSHSEWVTQLRATTLQQMGIPQRKGKKGQNSGSQPTPQGQSREVQSPSQRKIILTVPILTTQLKLHEHVACQSNPRGF